MDEFEQAFRRALGTWDGTAEADAAASALAAAGAEWDAIGGRTAERVTRECERRGWGVEDLVRLAGRELGPRHQQLAASLARARVPDTGAARADVPDTGAARADAADAGLAPFAKQARLDRFSAAAVLVELLCLYGRLPRVPAPGPPAAPARGESKVLGRVRALLAKAESTGFPQEAEALSAKAQQLMARHSIDEALLAAAGPGGAVPGVRRIGVDRPYEGAKALLLDAVATANGCESVWSSDFGFATVIGHEPDLDAVELLYTSLLVQADHTLRRGPSRRRDYRESFLIAYAARVRDRLTATTADEVSSRGDATDLLPALAARDAAVRDATRRLFPTATTTRLKGRDAQGWRHGETAADRARF